MAARYYRCILADPPWWEQGGGKIKRGADRHYQLLKKEGVLECMQESGVWRPATSGCHFWLWVTRTHLPSGLWLMEQLGFRYVSNAVWVKEKIGIGQYMRTQHEVLLLGTRGKAMVPPTNRRPSTVVTEAQQQHSRKPEASYKLIETVSPGPRLEMFARRERAGWAAWGKGVPK